MQAYKKAYKNLTEFVVGYNEIKDLKKENP
jgi:hypothetical protein